MIGRIGALALAGVSALAFATGAQAGAFGLREQSAEAQGLSYAGAASGSGGVSSMFWNPAVITMRPGWVTEQNLTYIGLHADIRPTAGTNPGFLPLGGSGEIGQGAIVPAGATSYQLSDKIWIGLQTGAPFGLITNPNKVWAGEVYGRSSRIFSLAFNPVVAYKVNDWLSIAAGPNIQYFKLTLRQALPITLSPTTFPSGFLKGDAWGVGYTAGATITPWDGTVLGIGYRSSVHHDLEGSAFGVGQVKANLNTPEKLSVGLTQAINPVTRINLGFEWDNWSRIGNVAIVSTALGLPVSNLPLNFKDGYAYSIGAEYDWSPSLTVRGGFAYEEVPIDDQNRSVRLPDNDRYTVSIGAGYRWSEKLTLNAAYSHVFLDKSNIFAGAGRNYDAGGLAFAGVVDASADIVSVGFRYVFGAPAAPLPAPIVRKF